MSTLCTCNKKIYVNELLTITIITTQDDHVVVKIIMLMFTNSPSENAENCKCWFLCQIHCHLHWLTWIIVGWRINITHFKLHLRLLTNTNTIMMWSAGLGSNVLEEINIVSTFRIEVGFKPLNCTQCEHFKSHTKIMDEPKKLAISRTLRLI
jgi:hypothetical protein